MRPATLLILALHLTVGLAAQHPLVGTWEMISGRGISAEGKKFAFDTTTRREVKIITPTHYMLIAQDVRGDSLIFNRSYAGEVKLDGNKYHEAPLLASVEIFQDVETDFTWKLEGDIFIQSGSIRRPDGKKVVLEALQFRRVKPAVANSSNHVVGTWSQQPSQASGEPSAGSQAKAGTVRLQFITPTHWMQISRAGEKFEYAVGGTYTVHDKAMSMKTDYTSVEAPGKIDLRQSVNGQKLSIQGTLTRPDGNTTTWNDVFEKLH